MAPTFSLQLLGRLVVVATLALLALWTLWSFLPALGWAAVLAVATWPLRERLVHNSARPIASAILLALAVGLVIVGPLAVIVIQGAREAVLIVQWVREARETGLGTPDWLSHLPIVGGYAAAWWQDHLGNAEATRELLGRAESMGLMQWTRHLGHELASRLIILGFTLLTLLFIYRDGPRIIEQARNVADRLLGPPARPFAEEAIAAVRATVNGLVLVGLGEGALLAIAYVLAGVSHPLTLGFVTGILAVVPFGAPLIYVVACLILVVQSRLNDKDEARNDVDQRRPERNHGENPRHEPERQGVTHARQHISDSQDGALAQSNQHETIDRGANRG